MKKTALKTFNDNALLYESKFMNLDLYNDSYEEFLSGLDQGSSVLEVGCGPGNITRYLLQKRPDLKILATDFAPKMVELASRNNPGAAVRELDARELLPVGDGFDALVCGFIAPYFTRSELEKLLLDASRVLSDGGILYISAIEGEYARSDWQSSSDGSASTMVYLYSEDDLSVCLSQAGFETTHIFRKAFGDSTHLIFLARLVK